MTRSTLPTLPLDPDVDPLRLHTVVLVFSGGCAGGLARYAVNRAWDAPTYAFPWDTLMVNLTGAFALAVLVVAAARLWPGHGWPRQLLGTGFLGAWTTFSAIAAGTDRLLAHGEVFVGLAYAVASIVGGTLAAAIGFAIARPASTTTGRC